MPRRLAAWLPVKIMSAGSLVSERGKLLLFGARCFYWSLSCHGNRILSYRAPSMLGAPTRKSKPPCCPFGRPSSGPVLG
jgi:hypothetical protein